MAVDMFFKIDDIAGESADDVKGAPSNKPHAGEIDVLSFSWGCSQSASMHHGTGGGSGKANVQDLSITKRIDKSTPNLVKYCCTGKHFGKATLTVRKAGDNPVEYFVLELQDVIISSVSTGGAGEGDTVHETVSFNFAQFKVHYTPQDGKGKPLATIPSGFNIAGNCAT
jgi:type VI secretion system secreted protein Hcp